MPPTSRNDSGDRRGPDADQPPASPDWSAVLAESRVHELIAVRGQLEVFAARLAAASATDLQLRQLGNQVQAMRENLRDRTRFIEADLKFHLQMAQIAGNQALLDLLQSIRSALRVWVERGLADDDEARLALDEHERVHAALLTRDPDVVETAMRAHMTTAGTRLERTLSLTSGDDGAL